MDEPRVWIRPRKCRDGTVTYHLRWIDTEAHCWKSRKAGTDRRRAEREAAALEEKLRAGTFQETRVATWAEWSAEYIQTIGPGEHRDIAERTLAEFGELMNLPPRKVTHAAVKAYVVKLRAKGNAGPTVNKKVRYLRLAFNEAIEDGYIVKHPLGRRWRWDPEEEILPREVTPEEEAVLLAKAEDTGGWRFRMFLETALATGGRRGELLGLSWGDLDLDDRQEAAVTFVRTKGKKPRRVPLHLEIAESLLRLKAQTLRDGGPFTVWIPSQVGKLFRATARAAGVTGVTIHDFRRTFCTRLIRAGVELSAVQRLAGHSSITTTLTYYNAVHTDPDLRAAVGKLAAPASATATAKKGTAG